jgi:hypothetical protein
VGFGSRGPRKRRLGIGIGSDLLVGEDIAHGDVVLDRGALVRGYGSADRGEAEAGWLYGVDMQARHPMDVAVALAGGPWEWSGYRVGCVYKMRLVWSGLDS